MRQSKYILFTIFLFVAKGLFASEDKIQVVTDRNIYISGDTLLSKIYLPKSEKSKIVYLSLVNSSGLHIIGSKLFVEDHEANGFLHIPDSLSSGCCLLKVCTNQNRNKTYLLKELFVVNRFESEQKNFSFDLFQFEKKETETLDIITNGLSNSYYKRQSVQLNIELPDELLAQIEDDVLVSVVPVNEGYPLGELYVKNGLVKDGLLEEKGIILKGKVIDKLSGKPEKGSMVYLCSPDSLPYFDYCKTMDDGKFYFALKDFYGEIPLIIQALNGGKEDRLKILLEKKFSNLEIALHQEKFFVPQEMNLNIQNSIKLAKYRLAYNLSQFNIEEKERKQEYDYPFYGKPKYQVDPDLFYDFTDFNELSREILPGVKFRQRKDSITLNIFNSVSETYFNALPFILLDGVVVTDLSLISKLKPSKIDWVDIINGRRYYGDIAMDGVLAIFSKEQNASMLIPSDNLLKFDYQTLQNQITYSNKSVSLSNIPDFRQVLYWDPEVKVKRQINFNFVTSDVSGDYQLKIVGKFKDGNICEFTKTFKVN